jgi:succinate dehydrogenase / fumarate reductase cytochrome b subunit
MAPRPLSPHLSVYKFKYTLTTSILNRLTGIGLSLALVFLVYWLMAVAAGAAAQARAAQFFAHPLLRLLGVLFIAAFCYHLLAGLRHLVWDTGHALEKRQSQRSAWLVVFVSAALTLLIVYLALRGGWHPS